MAGGLAKRALPFILLVVSLAGMVTFAWGFRLIDTLGLLACGAVAGASLAAIARSRGSGQAAGGRRAP